MDIEKTLNEYYERRRGIEDSFYFRMRSQVESRVKKLTKRYADKLKTK